MADPGAIMDEETSDKIEDELANIFIFMVLFIFFKLPRVVALAMDEDELGIAKGRGRIEGTERDEADDDDTKGAAAEVEVFMSFEI